MSWRGEPQPHALLFFPWVVHYTADAPWKTLSCTPELKVSLALEILPETGARVVGGRGSYDLGRLRHRRRRGKHVYRTRHRRSLHRGSRGCRRGGLRGRGWGWSGRDRSSTSRGSRGWWWCCRCCCDYCVGVPDYRGRCRCAGHDPIGKCGTGRTLWFDVRCFSGKSVLFG